MNKTIAILLIICATACSEEIEKDTEIKKHDQTTVLVSDTTLNQHPDSNKLVEEETKPISKEVIKKYPTLEELLKKETANEQHFSLSEKSDTIIFTKSGIAVYFPTNSFENQYPVELVIKEYIDTYSMLLKGLSTTSGKNILETNGMIDIQAFNQKKPIQLSKGKEIILHFPKPVPVKSTEPNLFYALKDNKENIDWIVEENSLTSFYAKSMTVGYGGKVFSYHVNSDPIEDFPVNIHFKDFSLNTKESKILDQSLLPNPVVFIEFEISDKGTFENAIVKSGIHETIDNKVLKKLIAFEPIYQELKSIPSFRKASVMLKFDFKSKFSSSSDYRREFENKYSELNEKGINSINSMEAQYYIFSTPKLTLINCDWFIDYKGKIGNMLVESNISNKTRFMFVFEKQKSILRADAENGYYSFNNIPIGVGGYLIGLESRNGKLFGCKKTITTSSKTTKPEFKEISLSELKNLTEDI